MIHFGVLSTGNCQSDTICIDKKQAKQLLINTVELNCTRVELNTCQFERDKYKVKVEKQSTWIKALGFFSLVMTGIVILK